MEEYKNCFEKYEISNFGNCRRLLLNGEYKHINGSITNKGYKYFQIIRNKKRINKLFHQLVAESFIGNRPIVENTKIDIDHIDRNKLNNNVNNLRYISHKENCINTDRYNVNIEETDPKKRAIVRTQLYNSSNKDTIKIKKKKYYNDNKDDILKSMKEYYQHNKEKRFQYGVQCRE